MGELERLGESEGFGWFLLTVLAENGWSIVRLPGRGFAGLPMWEALHPRLPDPIRKLGSLEEIAAPLFEEAAEILSMTPPAIPAGDVQLRLH
jgi:hypothetical protein